MNSYKGGTMCTFRHFVDMGITKEVFFYISDPNSAQLRSRKKNAKDDHLP